MYAILQNDEFLKLHAKHHRMQITRVHSYRILVMRRRRQPFKRFFLFKDEFPQSIPALIRNLNSLVSLGVLCQTTNYSEEYKNYLVSSNEYFHHCLDLSSGLELLLKRMSRSRRKALKRASLNDYEFIEFKSFHEIKKFYDIILEKSDSQKKFGIVSMDYMYDMINSGFAKIFIVRSSGMIRAGMYVHAYECQINAIHSFTTGRIDGLNWSDALYWSVLERCADLGFDRFDLGLHSVSQNDGITQYKKSLGAVKMPVYKYYFPTNRLYWLCCAKAG